MCTQQRRNTGCSNDESKKKRSLIELLTARANRLQMLCFFRAGSQSAPLIIGTVSSNINDVYVRGACLSIFFSLFRSPSLVCSAMLQICRNSSPSLAFSGMAGWSLCCCNYAFYCSYGHRWSSRRCASLCIRCEGLNRCRSTTLCSPINRNNEEKSGPKIEIEILLFHAVITADNAPYSIYPNPVSRAEYYFHSPVKKKNL